jgi:hypothetical protein
MTEALVLRLGRAEAKRVAEEAARSGRPLTEAPDPTTYLGSAGALVDRALKAHEEGR